MVHEGGERAPDYGDRALSFCPSSGFRVDVSVPGAGRNKALVYLAAALSLFAALLHLWAMPEHMREWWGYGAFFLASAVAQGGYGTILTRWPRRSLFLAGVGGNLSVLALYLLTRTVGIPFFGPHAGEVEGFGLVDLCAAASELGIILALGALLMKNLSFERKMQVAIVVTASALLVGHLLHLLADGGAGGHGS